MNINRINFLSSPKRTFKANNQRHVLKSNGFDTVSFGSSTNKNKSCELDKCIDSEELKNEIKTKLTLQKDGSINKEIEQEFLIYYKLLLATFNIDDTNQEAKDNAAKAILETLRALGEHNNSKMDMSTFELTALAYNVISQNQNNIYEVYSACKNQEGNIDKEKARQIFLWQYAEQEERFAHEVSYILEHYCKNKENKVDDGRIIDVATLFSCTMCENIEDLQRALTFVLSDVNDFKSDIDENKYGFLISKVLQLFSLSVDEFKKNYDIDFETRNYDDTDAVKNALVELIKKQSVDVAVKLISDATDEKGNFNLAKAEDVFDFLLNYAQKYRYNLNELKKFKVANPTMSELFQKEISLNELEGISAARYDNSLYRMHRILFESDTGQKYLN